MSAGSLRELREKAGMSRAALAAALDMSPSIIARWEDGSRTPSEDAVTKLSTLFQSEVVFKPAKKSIKKKPATKKAAAKKSVAKKSAAKASAPVETVVEAPAKKPRAKKSVAKKAAAGPAAVQEMSVPVAQVARKTVAKKVPTSRNTSRVVVLIDEQGEATVYGSAVVFDQRERDIKARGEQLVAVAEALIRIGDPSIVDAVSERLIG